MYVVILNEAKDFCVSFAAAMDFHAAIEEIQRFFGYLSEGRRSCDVDTTWRISTAAGSSPTKESCARTPGKGVRAAP
jgi:hypothetical protein